MSNINFVKDNLLPNEQIIATAKWHWMKKWWLTIMLVIITIIALIIHIDDAAYYRRWNIYNVEKMLNEESLSQEWLQDLQEQLHELKETPILFLSNDWDNDFGPLFIICVLLTIISYFPRKWVCKYDEFAITNLRVISKVGLIRRRAFELHNEQVESIEVRQGILGRLMGFGTLIPRGVGASNVRITFVKDPFEFRQHFYDLKKGQQKTIE